MRTHAHCMLVGVASICHKYVEQPCMAAMLGPLPTPLDQDGEPDELCIERYHCSFAALCFYVSVALLS